MAQSGNDRTAIPDAASLREVLARFQDPLPHVATWQIVTTILPLIALLVAMHAGLAFGWWPLLALGVPAAALTVRTFIIQHDCGHGSFCRARRANDLLGRFCSLLTLTPYAQWRRHHAKHHGAWNDLDRRNARGRDIYSSCLTVAEEQCPRHLASATPPHRQASRNQPAGATAANFSGAVSLPVRRAAHLARRTAQRAPYQPLAGCAPRHSRGDARCRPSGGGLLAVIVPVSIVGVWLFSLQHHFAGTHWARHVQWDPVDGALRGSSFLRSPRLLQWVTGNIGFHHVHHASPRVPNYRLEACHGVHPGFTVASVLTLADGLRASRHALWDEGRGRMVTFAEAIRSNA